MAKKKKRVVSESTRKKISEGVSKAMSLGKTNGTPSNKVTTTRYSKKTWYFSIKNNESFYADSLAEVMQMINLDNNVNVVRWTKKHGIRIPYIFNYKSHYTIPDFMVQYVDTSIKIIEVKGRITIKELIKKKATEEYCIKMNYLYEFITTKDLNITGEYSELLKTYKNLKKTKKKK